MRLLFFLFLLFTTGCATVAQDFSALYEAHPEYRDPRVSDRRFKHSDIREALQELPPAYHQQQLGVSIEGRSIHLVRIGQGDIPVLLWSQMHGDEPTATMAMLDLFRFFAVSDAFDELRQTILDACTLYFIPLLNPDGAERFQRRNSLGVDLNRDALRLQSPESRILKQVRDSIDAAWGFNLHDQSRYYSAGAGNPYTAAISFLAPAYNVEKSVNEKRADAMQLIGYMNDILQDYIPNQVGKYDDTFEPRAFGDNIQKWGTRTILIETGGLKDDLEKQELRRLNFLILLRAFHGIATESYEAVSRNVYEQIPFNDYNAFHDLIIRNGRVILDGQPYIMDIAYRRDEVDYDNHRRFYPRGRIADQGDLSTTFGYTELDASGMEVLIGRTWSESLPTVNAALQTDLWTRVLQGYLYFPVDQRLPNDSRFHQLPVQLLGQGDRARKAIQPGSNPALLLKKDGQLQYLVVNGQLFDVRDGQSAFQAYRK